MRISDWSSDVCSSDLANIVGEPVKRAVKSPVAKPDRLPGFSNLAGGHWAGAAEVAAYLARTRCFVQRICHRHAIGDDHIGLERAQYIEKFAKIVFVRPRDSKGLRCRGLGHEQAEIGRATWRERVCENG